MNIFVGNLSRELTEEELRQSFESFGKVTAVRIVTDRSSGISRGFGYIEMPDRVEAQAAIDGLKMKELAGRILDVSESPDHRSGKRDHKYRGGGRGRMNKKGRSGKSGGSKRRRF